VEIERLGVAELDDEDAVEIVVAEVLRRGDLGRQQRSGGWLGTNCKFGRYWPFLNL